MCILKCVTTIRKRRRLEPLSPSHLVANPHRVPIFHWRPFQITSFYCLGKWMYPTPHLKEAFKKVIQFLLLCVITNDMFCYVMYTVLYECIICITHNAEVNSVMARGPLFITNSIGGTWIRMSGSRWSLWTRHLHAARIRRCTSRWGGVSNGDE